jgi:hypothetical protein
MGRTWGHRHEGQKILHETTTGGVWGEQGAR